MYSTVCKRNFLSAIVLADTFFVIFNILDFQPLLADSAWRTAGIQSVLDSHWNQ
jgi:hypothetical protein